MSTFGSQSMVAPLRRVIVKRPEEAFRDAAAIESEWRRLNFTAAPDLAAAAAEHRALVAALEAAGAEVIALPVDPRTTMDSLYVHDPAIVTRAGAIILEMGKPERRGEGSAIEDAFRRLDVPILGSVTGPAYAEAGDLIFVDETTLLAGRGFRTNQLGIARLRVLLRPLGVEVVEVHLPYGTGPGDVLHLMSMMSMLDDDLAVVYRPLLPVPAYELLASRGIERVDVPDEEYATQGANVLALGPRRALMLEGNPHTRERMERAGCRVETITGTEIAAKGCGGPTCLTRPVLRG